MSNNKISKPNVKDNKPTQIKLESSTMKPKTIMQLNTVQKKQVTKIKKQFKLGTQFVLIKIKQNMQRFKVLSKYGKLVLEIKLINKLKSKLVN